MASTDHVALDLLNRAHPPEVASKLFVEKVLHKPILLRPTSPDPTSQDARAQRRLRRLRIEERSRRRQKPKPMSAKEKRTSGIFEIPKGIQKYEIYEPLHKLWLEYIWETLDMTKERQTLTSAQGVGGKLASVDYHGARLTVVRAKCVSLVGLEGIVARDTKFTFQIITSKNELRSTFSLLQHAC